MNVAAVAIRHRPAVLLATSIVTAAGLWAGGHLPAGIYPEADFDRIVVVASGGTFEPRDMVVAVTRPLEEALIGVVDLRRVRSRTVRGSAELALDFRPGADLPLCLQQVQGRIAARRTELPSDLEIVAERLTPSVFPILQFELRGADPIVLRDLADYTIRPRLARLEDVGSIEVEGGLVREVSVELDPDRLVNAQTAIVDVTEAIRSSNVAMAAGRVDRQYQQWSMVVSGLASTPEAVGNVVVRQTNDASTRVRDLGSVHFGTQDLFQLAAGNGEQAALINVSRQPTGNILRVERAVLEEVRAIRQVLPAGVSLEPVYDLGGLVRDSVNGVRDAILLGGALATFTLLLFLGQPGMTAVAASTVPLAIVGALGGLALFKGSINLMSLGGIAVAVGLVIDNAVVVVEILDRRLREAQGSRTLAIGPAIMEILGPVTTSTITTVVVFAPLGLLEGVVGQFFRSFSVALTLAVLLSLVYSTTLIPAVMPWVLTRERKSTGRLRLRLGRLERGYGRVTRAAMRRPWFAAGASLLFAVLGSVLWARLDTGFLPEMDEGGFILDYWAPTGTSLSETDRQLHQLEEVLRSDDAVKAFTRRTGAELGLFATAPNTGDLTVLLVPKRVRHDSVYEVMDRVRRRIETRIPDLRVEFHQVQADLLGDLTGAPDPIEIKVFHPDARVAEHAASAIAERIEGVPGLEDIFNGVPGDLAQTIVALDPRRVARVGLTNVEVEAQARAAMFGEDAGSVRETDRLVPIRVRLSDSARLGAGVLSRTPIVGPNGWAPLSTLGTVVDSLETSELLRENLRPMTVVTAGIDVRASSLGKVMRLVRSRLRDVPTSPGTSIEFGGQEAGQRQSFRQLLAVFALAAGGVLLVMVIHFESISGPALILVASLLAPTGAFAALALTRTPFNVSSFMGLILLIGLAVKNSIILYDAACRLHASGLSAVEAILEAGRIRLRPILMTSLCTVTGLLPLAVGLGAGAELQRPLAIAVIGGLLLSTVVTLVVLPAGLLAAGVLRQRDAGERRSLGADVGSEV